MNQHIVNTAPPSSIGSLRAGYCSRVLLHYVGRAELLAVVLGVTVALATGCSSTGTGMNARLVSPVLTTQRNSDPQDDGWYQPPRSPGFDDLFGS